MLAPPHRDHAFRDEGAVEPLQRHHVGDRAERHEIEQGRADPARGAASCPEAALAQFAVDRNHRHEHEADGGEMAKLRQIVLPVRIDQRRHRRQLLIGLMVIDHHAHRARASSPPRAARCWWCRNRPSPAASRPSRRATASLRRSGRSPQTCDRGYGSADRGRHGAETAPATQSRSRHRRRSRRKSRPFRALDRVGDARCSLGMSVSMSGSGISRRTVGSRNASTSSARHLARRSSAPAAPARRAVARSRRARTAAFVEPVAPRAAGHRLAHVEEKPAHRTSLSMSWSENRPQRPLRREDQRDCCISRSAPATRTPGGTNESAVHWDMVKDLRPGGELIVDGELVQRNGAWLI